MEITTFDCVRWFRKNMPYERVELFKCRPLRLRPENQVYKCTKGYNIKLDEADAKKILASESDNQSREVSCESKPAALLSVYSVARFLRSILNKKLTPYDTKESFVIVCRDGEWCNYNEIKFVSIEDAELITDDSAADKKAKEKVKIQHSTALMLRSILGPLVDGLCEKYGLVRKDESIYFRDSKAIKAALQSYLDNTIITDLKENGFTIKLNNRYQKIDKYTRLFDIIDVIPEE